jgi:replication factor C subunit 3/5
VSQLDLNSVVWLHSFPSYRYPFQPDQKVAAHDWEIFLKDTAKMIVHEQSPQKLLQIRSRLYELMIHGIPSEFIFKVSFKVVFVFFFSTCETFH